MSYEIILAPLQGYTDAIFRDIYFRHFTGIDEAVAPFIATMGQHKIKLSNLKDVIPENNPNCKVIPQILSNVAEDFVFLAHHLVEIGYDTVNLNMGCPHSKVAKKKRGSGMLAYPEMVERFFDSVFDSIASSSLICKISIKIRLGRYDKNEIFALLPIFEKYPFEEIIVHPRTGVQMYEGNADIDSFIQLSDKTSHNLVYNGDIKSLTDFSYIADRLSVIRKQIKRFMIGRGVLANPFLPSEIKEKYIINEDGYMVCNEFACEDSKNRADAIERIKFFHDELFETYSRRFYGPLHVVGRMKGFWTYIGLSFANHVKEIKKILKTKSREHYAVAAENFFAAKPIFAPDD